MTTVVAEIMPGVPPAAGVTISGVTGTADFTVAWIDTTDPDGIWNPVRGAEPLTIAGGAFVRDNFPPLNIPIQYGVFAWPNGDQIGLSNTITLTSTSAWLQDPLAPRTFVEVVVEPGNPEGDRTQLAYGSYGSAIYAQATDFAQPIGATYPVAAIGQRMAASQVPLEFFHQVAAEGGKLRRLLLGAGQLVLRDPHRDPSQVLDPVASIVVGDVRESRDLSFVNIASDVHQETVFTCTATQVRPVTLRFVVPWWTYDQVRAIWGALSYDAVDSATPGKTYIDWAKDPSAP